MKLPIQIAAGIILFVVLDRLAAVAASWLITTAGEPFRVLDVSLGNGFVILFKTINFFFF